MGGGESRPLFFWWGLARFSKSLYTGTMTGSSVRSPGWTADELRAAIRERIERAGSGRALAEELGISASFLSSLLSGRSKPSPRVLEALGLRRVDRYVPLSEEE